MGRHYYNFYIFNFFNKQLDHKVVLIPLGSIVYNSNIYKPFNNKEGPIPKESKNQNKIKFILNLLIIMMINKIILNN